VIGQQNRLKAHLKAGTILIIFTAQCIHLFDTWIECGPSQALGSALGPQRQNQTKYNLSLLSPQSTSWHTVHPQELFFERLTACINWGYRMRQTDQNHWLRLNESHDACSPPSICVAWSSKTNIYVSTKPSIWYKSRSQTTEQSQPECSGLQYHGDVTKAECLFSFVVSLCMTLPSTWTDSPGVRAIPAPDAANIQYTVIDSKIHRCRMHAKGVNVPPQDTAHRFLNIHTPQGSPKSGLQPRVLWDLHSHLKRMWGWISLEVFVLNNSLFVLVMTYAAKIVKA
jgi:hypothetical protein